MRDAAERRLAVGFFDGVHLGHQAILKGADGALTFDVHPLAVLAPDRAPRLLMSLDERVAAIRACGVDEVRVLGFTPELAATEPEAFLDFIRDFPVVRCGDNWRFGSGGRGDAAFLRARGFAVEVVPYAEWEGSAVSSSRIRAALGEGRVAAAAAMLGRPYAVSAPVVAGKGLGRELGYPTLNVAPARPLAIRCGVYAVRFGTVPAVANYGLAPTLGDAAWREPVLEVHLLGDAADCERATVTFDAFIRDERRFDSLEDLRRQIAADCDFVTKGDYIR